MEHGAIELALSEECSHVTLQNFAFLPLCLAIVFVFSYHHPSLWLKKMPPQD
jgi:hypothetical protein